MKLTTNTNNIFMRMFLTLTVVFAVLVASNFLYAAISWPDIPIGTPTAGNNASAPINVSTSIQDKAGVLSLGGLLVNGDTYVNNQVRAFEYCDRDGLNCFKSGDGEGTGGGTGDSIMGEIGSTGADWPDIITCGFAGSYAENGSLLYVYGSVYGSTVVYKFSDNMENSGNEVAVSFNRLDGSYKSQQGLNASCAGRNIQDFISSGEAYYNSSGWSGGSLPSVAYWLTGPWVLTGTSACESGYIGEYTSYSRTVDCISSKTGLQVSDDVCTITKPAVTQTIGNCEIDT